MSADIQSGVANCISWCHFVFWSVALPSDHFPDCLGAFFITFWARNICQVTSPKYNLTKAEKKKDLYRRWLWKVEMDLKKNLKTDSKVPYFLLDRKDSANLILPNADNQARNKHTRHMLNLQWMTFCLPWYLIVVGVLAWSSTVTHNLCCNSSHSIFNKVLGKKTLRDVNLLFCLFPKLLCWIEIWRLWRPLVAFHIP